MAPGSKSNAQILLGSVTGVFGVRGEIRIFLHHRESDFLAVLREVELVRPDGTRHTAQMKARPAAGGRIVAQISGVTDPSRAAAWVGADVFVAREALPAPAEGEFYVSDVVGQPVRSGGVAIGRVTAVHPGDIDILEVDVDGSTAYLPCLKDRILAIGPSGVDVVPGAWVVEEG